MNMTMIRGLTRVSVHIIKKRSVFVGVTEFFGKIMINLMKVYILKGGNLINFHTKIAELLLIFSLLNVEISF